MPDNPYTPGNEVVFTKPNIPDCWTPQPVINTTNP